MSASPSVRIRVWDAPTRLFHWSMAVCVIGAWLTREDEGSLWHLLFGYTLAGWVLFRIVWGVIGSRYARFGEFVRGPAAVAGYVRGLFGRPHRDYIGHNPLGALAVIAMLLLAAGLGVTGWQMAANGGEEAFKEWHELLADTLLVVVGVHVLGVLVSSWRHRQNLPLAIVTGDKTGPAEAGIRGSAAAIALLLLAAMAGFWGWSLRAGQLPFGLSATAEMGEAGERDEASGRAARDGGEADRDDAKRDDD